MTGETTGPIIGATGLVGFAAAVVAVKVGALGAVMAAAMPVLSTAAAVGFVVGLVALVPRSNTRRIHIRAPRDHGHRHDAIRHEAMGHAAVGAGVNGSTRGIRARIYPDGSGWCDVPRTKGVAESLAITGAGEYVAGPSGCQSDRARYRRDLNRVPSSMRGQTKARADELMRRHANSDFGRRVARRLERTGRFR